MTPQPRLCRHRDAARLARRRAGVLAALRSHFEQQGSVEVEAPPLQPCSAPDAHLHPPRVDLPGWGDAWWLQTSPELACKRLVMAGLPRVHSLGLAYRGGREELSTLHQPQFTLLEWYRPGTETRALEADLLSLGAVVADALGTAVPVRGPTLSVCAALRAHDLDPELLLAGETKPFAVAARAAGLTGCADDDDATTLLSRVLVERIEPALRETEGWAFLTGFPAFMGTLAAGDPEDARLLLRVEGWLHGVEIANGYVELDCPEEHRRRWEREQRQAGSAAVPLDEGFLEELARDGLPPTVGMALGVDRLLMVMSGVSAIADVLPLHLGGEYL